MGLARKVYDPVLPLWAKMGVGFESGRALPGVRLISAGEVLKEGLYAGVECVGFVFDLLIEPANLFLLLRGWSVALIPSGD